MAPTTSEVLARISGYPRLLTWADFRRVPSSPSQSFKAQTSAQYAPGSYSMGLEHGYYRLTFANPKIIRVSLDRSLTWVVTSWLRDASNPDKADLLQHEQGHFDIVGLIARDLCRGLMSLEVSEDVIGALRGVASTASARRNAAWESLRRDVAGLQNDARQLMNRVENHVAHGVHVDGEYERQTNHSLNQVQQRRWNDLFQHSRDNDCSLGLTLELFRT